MITYNLTLPEKLLLNVQLTAEEHKDAKRYANSSIEEIRRRLTEAEQQNNTGEQP